MRQRIETVALALFVVAAVVAVVGGLTMLLINRLLSDVALTAVFGGPLNFGKTLALIALSWLLFGGHTVVGGKDS